MKKNYLLYVIFSIMLQAYTLDEAQELCRKNQGENAIKIYTVLSNNGDDNATKKLIHILGVGECGVHPDSKKQTYFIKKLAKKGDAWAAHVLGSRYLDGVGIEKNSEKAVYWLTKDRDASSAEVQYDVANEFSMIGMDDEALKWYLMSAKQNYVRSFYWIGATYLYGRGSTLQDPRKALFWWGKAANLGDTECMEKVAYLYKSRYLRNEEKYVFWLEKRAEHDKYKGNAQYELGLYYFDDNSKYKNKKRAAYWIEKAHKNGSKDAKEFWNKNELWRYK